MRITYFLLLVVLLTSCREKVQDEFRDFEQFTTINALLHADSIVTLHVALTNSLSNDTLPVVNDAIVNLFINDAFAEKLVCIGNGLYQSNMVINALNKVHCEVTSQSGFNATATCIIPASSQPLTLNIIHNGWVTDEGRVCPAVQFTIANKPPSHLYYELAAKIYSGYGNNIKDYTFSEEQRLLLFSTLSENDSIISKTVEFSSNSWGNNEKYAYRFELRSVSIDYYNYAQSLVLYEQGRYPSFDVGSIIPYNLYSNVENGYGIFAGYSSYVTDTIN